MAASVTALLMDHPLSSKNIAVDQNRGQATQRLLHIDCPSQLRLLPRLSSSDKWLRSFREYEPFGAGGVPMLYGEIGDPTMCRNLQAEPKRHVPL